MFVPSMLLNKPYTIGSLQNEDGHGRNRTPGEGPKKRNGG
jgi:hypothetical protein